MRQGTIRPNGLFMSGRAVVLDLRPRHNPKAYFPCRASRLANRASVSPSGLTGPSPALPRRQVVTTTRAVVGADHRGADSQCRPWGTTTWR
jgi:hypothetical protein